MKKHNWVFANSFMELEKEAIESMSELCPIRPVGPLVPTSLLDLDENLDLGIELWKPEYTFIYVSFSSVVILLSAKEVEAIATIKNQGLVVSYLWCPRTKVLGHPAIAYFITRVPVIGYPQWTDQPTNAKLVSHVFKNGLKLNNDGVINSQEVEKLRINAMEQKPAAWEAVTGGGSSNRNI
ncbi:hypothetical protein ACOSQ3_005311 [Xanthoceras sorbifolium]